MATTPFSAAICASIAGLNTDGLTHDQWADAAMQCARSFAALGIDDPVVRSAAALGGLIRSHQAAPTPISSPVVEAFTAAATADMALDDRDAVRVEGRTALRFATHAATLNSRGLPLILLSGVERDLTASPPVPEVVTLGSALENWRVATAAAGRGGPDVSVHVAIAIAVTQRALLRRSRELLSGVEANPDNPGNVDRLTEGIETSLAAWSSRAERWYDTSVNAVPHDASRFPIRLLSLAATDLTTALTQHSSPSLELEALICSGFGGNLIAGVVATGASRESGSTVVRAAARLELVADHFTDQRFAPVFRDHTSPTPPTVSPTDNASRLPSYGSATRPQGSLGRPEGLPVGAPPLSVRAAPDVPVQWLSREDEVELAQRRDAGIIAQAALDGDPAACSVAASATVSELRHLAAGGRAAVAQLIASMIPAMETTNRWIPRDERADALQNAAVDVASAAARWDPRKGARWLTFAWNTSWWAATDSRKELDTRPIPVEFTTETLGRPVQEAALGPAEVLLGRLRESEKHHLVHQIRTLDADAIRPEDLDVVLKYHGLDGEPARNFVQIAKEEGTSPSTVARHYHEAINTLRTSLPATPGSDELKPWQRPDHTPRNSETSPRR